MYWTGQEIQKWQYLMANQIGAIELIPKRLFYDYKAKYTKKAKTKHIMPARLSKKQYNGDSNARIKKLINVLDL